MEPLDALGRLLEGMREKIATLETRCDQLERQLAEAKPEMLSTEEFCRRHGVSRGTIKAQLFYRETNGLAAAFHQKIKGGKVWVDPRKYFELLKVNRGRQRRRPR
jgi:hypothetical protein